MDCFSSCSSSSAAVTSPCNNTCVCASTNPGSTVPVDRSITSAPAGALPPTVTLTILAPSIRIQAFVTGASLLPSINRPARIATRFAGGAVARCACDVPTTSNRQTAVRPIPERRHSFMVSSRKPHSVTSNGAKGKKKASRSLRTAGPFFLSGLKTSLSELQDLNPYARAKLQTQSSVRRLRIRSTQRPAYPFLRNGRSPARRQPCHPGFPALLNQVEGSQKNRNSGKAKREQRKRCQKLTHKIEL